MDILQEIVAWKRIEVEHEKALMPPARLYAQVEQIMQQQTSVRSMSQRLRQSDSGIISEFKRKSPSKGWIHQDAHPEDVVTAYERGGACAASILTDGKYFGGCMDFVRAVRPLVDLPLLRKEFIIDEYQLFQAKAIGADAVLLIAAAAAAPVAAVGAAIPTAVRAAAGFAPAAHLRDLLVGGVDLLHLLLGQIRQGVVMVVIRMILSGELPVCLFDFFI